MNHKVFVFSIPLVFMMILFSETVKGDNRDIHSEKDSLAKSADTDEDDRDSGMVNLNRGSKFEVYMSIEGMGEENEVIGDFLNFQKYKLQQSINLAHRKMKHRKAAARAKRFWLIGIFRDPLEISPADIPWPIQSDIQLDNDFHTITPLIGF